MQQTNAHELPLTTPQQPPTERKDATFARLAEPRVNRALDSIRLVGNLSNRGRYDYDPVDVAAIMSTLRQAVNDIEARFRSNSPREEFKLRR